MLDSEPGSPPVVVVGAGPAGLTAALLLARSGVPVVILEASHEVGGISRTVQRDGWRFDLGGHRFFTKVPRVRHFWHEVLGADDFLRRPRMSRILYRGKLFDYPLKPVNALRGLGAREAVRCLASYAWTRMRPPRDQSNLEGWVAARFGYRLYRIFFKTYTEKVWGVPATAIQADWAAQRIKNLSLAGAVVDAVGLRRNNGDITTLISSFEYPRYGPGMMWERVRDLAVEAGARLVFDAPVTGVERAGGQAVAVTVRRNGALERIACRAVISSMPLPHLALGMDPPPVVRTAANGLSYRDFLTVALIVPEQAVFPDNWIYIHTPGVRVGRIQNFGSWSPHLVKDGWTCLGLEYFVNADDELWRLPDEDLVALGRDELTALNLVTGPVQAQGYVVRVPRAYPVYDAGYADRVDVLRRWLESEAPNVLPVGRNGMHRYNNQDHSMLTAMLAVENLLGAEHDLWSVNVEADYHEEGRQEPEPHDLPRQTAGGVDGTGRSAPVVGVRAHRAGVG